MKKYLYIREPEISNLTSAYYFLSTSGNTKNLSMSSSFLELSNLQFPIFTDVNKFIIGKIKEKKITSFGFIFDGYKQYSLDAEALSILSKAQFVHILGNEDQDNIFNNFKNVKFFPSLGLDSIITSDNNSSDKLLVESSNLPDLLEFIDSKEQKISTVYAIETGLDNKLFWERNFLDRGVKVIFFKAELSFLKHALKEMLVYKPATLALNALLGNINSISVVKYIELLNLELAPLISNIKNSEVSEAINIICYKPTYLFKDLVERFVEKGCVHSDFPLPGYGKYIWMRPQEIWHIEHLMKGDTHTEISVNYKKDADKFLADLDFKDIKDKSIAIHHGTCFQPLYQFDPYLLAKALYDVKKVVGVCEIEECYGPSYEIANKENFIFVPIGYDNELFITDLISKKNRLAGDVLNIGFVGRAYGTNNAELLDKSKMAEPKGYRKGGDILFNILSSLKLRNINFCVHILGQNWEELVDELNQLGIDNVYYARDKNITYKEYPKVYSKFDTLLITARCEGGPVSAIEALSLGVPIVSTDVGVVKYLSKAMEYGVHSFKYNKKWHIADTAMAIEHISSIYNSNISFEDRVRINEGVDNLTTNNWVAQIIAS